MHDGVSLLPTSDCCQWPLVWLIFGTVSLLPREREDKFELEGILTRPSALARNIRPSCKCPIAQLLQNLHISTELKECIKKGQTSRPRRAAEIAQLGERQTEDLKVSGSTPKTRKE